MDGIAPLTLLDGGTTIAILIFLVVGFISDRIVSGKRLREERAERDRERDEKLQALEIVKGYGGMLESLLVHAETSNQILRSLPHPSDLGERV